MAGAYTAAVLPVNTSAVDYRNGIGSDNSWMDIYQIRLANLEWVLQEDFQGVKAHLADAIGVAPNNISRYFSTNPKHRRNVSDQMARDIERVTRRQYGWMDRIHNEEPTMGDLNREAADLTEEELKRATEFIRFMKAQRQPSES